MRKRRSFALATIALALSACEPIVAPQAQPVATSLPDGVIANLTEAASASGATWRGLTVAAENRCSDYDRADYPYPQSVEAQIAANLGGWWSPYDGATFPNQESDIEHIVSLSEAHDSGLCAATAATRRSFARDLDNLTLATSSLNRNQKRGYDAAEWQPEHNVCWFAGRVLAVRLEYGLTVNRSEAYALEGMLVGCSLEQILRPVRVVTGATNS